MVVCIFPLVGGTENQVAPNSNDKIGLNENKLNVNAGASIKTIKSSKKKVKAKKVTKKVKAATKYKVKVRYKYKGKWRTKWVYKYVQTYTPVYTPPSSTPSTPKYNPVEGNPVITPDTVSADGKCSCSLYTDYNIHHGTYVNYCPHCTKYHTLSYTNQQGCPEGMFYCDMGKGGCDADYCIVHGKEHVNGDPKYLTPA
ncbi:MAG: hypothetical protein HZC47_08440 [Methanobacterium sp.]|uniref:hypothetical protein n=1 Tax=Methanobacterium sp. TaxID=2164 RepID=UPI003D652266|nr:hypothetical protein [Methanobacterium sp.]